MIHHLLEGGWRATEGGACFCVDIKSIGGSGPAQINLVFHSSRIWERQYRELAYVRRFPCNFLARRGLTVYICSVFVTVLTYLLLDYTTCLFLSQKRRKMSMTILANNIVVEVGCKANLQSGC